MVSIIMFCGALGRRSCGLQRLALYSFLGFATLFLLFHFRQDDLQHRKVMNIKTLIDPHLKEINVVNETRRRKSLVHSDEIVSNCGMKTVCPVNSFPVHIYTGKDKNDSPKLCVNGMYVFNRSLNGGGRGLNVALVDPTNFVVLRAQSFDTYESDATQLEMFLEKYILPGDIIIVSTFDEAATKLSTLAKNMLYDLGSGCIQNLKFRSSWYMISQKGINGFTPYEKLFISTNTKKWAELIDVRMCIPRTIVGQSIHPDTIAQQNKNRRDFCTKNSGYGDFCRGILADEPLLPAPHTNISMHDHPIYSVPIAVIAGVSMYSLPMTLETLIRQPGINPRLVVVYYLPVFPEAEQLCHLFGFKAVKMLGIDSYEDQMDFALNKTVEFYPDAGHIIVIEEELVLSPDFLLYMAKMMPLLEKDPTLYSVSAWNDNGYKGVSSNPEAVYRVEGFPGLAFMISKTTYIRQMRGNMKTCCSRRASEGWSLPDEMEMVIPDVSRVVHRPHEGLGSKTAMMEELFNRERVASMVSFNSIVNPLGLIMLKYENSIEELILKAVILSMSPEQLEKCIEHGVNGQSYFSNSLQEQRMSYVLYFKQAGANDYRILRKLCKCFGLFSAPDAPPRGLHKSMIRFTLDKNDLFLVGSASPYFRFIPNNYRPLELEVHLLEGNAQR